MTSSGPGSDSSGVSSAAIRFAVRNPAVVLIIVAVFATYGIYAWRNKTVDAIPDISESQVIVTVDWPGRSPQDVEDQVTYPLATELASVKDVREVRGLSGFGFSRVYVVFDEPFRLLARSAVDDSYDARTRVLEKLSSVQRSLPPGVVPELGPDATALGQIFMYTVDGPYDLATLRGLQDFTIRYELQSVAGVAEVAGVGGMVREYQVDVDPDKLRYYGISILDVSRAIRDANLDVGAKTIEQGGEEWILHGLGFIRARKDIEDVAVGHLGASGFVPAGSMARGRMRSLVVRGGGRTDRTQPVDAPTSHRPVLVRDVAAVTIGPAFRRGALADGTGERVGGVVTMRIGANPRAVIERVRGAIQRMNDPENSLLPEGVRIVPFYDRSRLIDETIETLDHALASELWITMLVVFLFLMHVRSALVIALTLPLAVAAAFVLMDAFGVDSNLMSLTGIAIAIGTMVDMGIIMTENIYRRLQEAGASANRVRVIEEAACEVGPALLTAVATTVVSFVPIFFLTGMEGKLFRPLAWTKTFALTMAAVTGILVVPVMCRLFLGGPASGGAGENAHRVRRTWLWAAVAVVAGVLAAKFAWFGFRPLAAFVVVATGVFVVGWRVERERMVPIDSTPVSRFIQRMYAPTLRWILEYKALFLLVPLAIVVWGALVAFGAKPLAAPARAVLGDKADRLAAVAWLERAFPGLGQEFMPPLDEGALLYMPSLLPRASLSQALAVMKRQNAAMERVPEVAKVVGKIGRAETALDPAPIGMIETVVILKPRSLWRPGKLKRDIVNELMRTTHCPGVLEGAGAWLQPIETRVVMLSSDIRAPLAVRLVGTPRDANGRALDAKDGILELERRATEIRRVIASVPGVAGPNVENLGGKLYVEFRVMREKAAHYGVSVADVQGAIATAIGGTVVSQTYEGREQYGIRVAYPRELRDRIDALDKVVVRSRDGSDVPIGLVATIDTASGPAAIKTIDGRLRMHVMFTAVGRAEGEVMEDALARIRDWRAETRAAGRPDPIPDGVSITAAGRYESQQRARDRFAVLIPICFGLILFFLFIKFRRWWMTLNVLLAVPVCVAGGVILLDLFPHLKDAMYQLSLWDQPSTGPIYITVAVVVGFIALAGIATDDGVVIGTMLEDAHRRAAPTDVASLRAAVVDAGLRRIRPCLMTTFTTILALYPILASTGRGSDVAQPMAIPAVGGMIASFVSLFVVPCIYCAVREIGLRRRTTSRRPSSPSPADRGGPS